MNNDGISDLAIGAPGAGPDGRSRAGATYVVFGSRTIGSGGTLQLSSLNGNNGMLITGAASGDESGQSVSFAGDIDNDGLDDLILGAPGVDIGDARDSGAGYVIFGSTTLVAMARKVLQHSPVVMDLFWKAQESSMALAFR